MPTKRVLRILWTVLLDVLLTGVVLVVFALFHHVLPRAAGSGEVLATPTPPVATATPAPTADPSDPTPAVSPSPTPTTGPAVLTATSYHGATLSIDIATFQRDGATGYVADIRTTDPLSLRTYMATGSYSPGSSAWPMDMAKAAGALLAINGDYFGIRNQGVVVRDGVLYRSTVYKDVLVMYRDGTMRTFSAADFDVAAMKAAGAWQAWSFGPMLLKDGQPMTVFDSSVTTYNPRTAIGYYEPGHYCFVVVDGRQPGYSGGLTMAQLSQYFFDLGCTVAYNLDGGQSSEMIFDGALVNRPYRDGRRVSDIVYFALPEEAAP